MGGKAHLGSLPQEEALRAGRAGRLDCGPGQDLASSSPPLSASVSWAAGFWASVWSLPFLCPFCLLGKHQASATPGMHASVCLSWWLAGSNPGPNQVGLRCHHPPLPYVQSLSWKPPWGLGAREIPHRFQIPKNGRFLGLRGSSWVQGGPSPCRNLGPGWVPAPPTA